jgi:hypothetical protein
MLVLNTCKTTHACNSTEVLVALRWWPSLAETCKGFIALLKYLLQLMEFNPNFTCAIGWSGRG